MPSSKDYTPLQAVDVLLWIMQRDDEAGFETLRERIREKADPFYISRGISELIRLAGLKQVSEHPLTDDELQKGQELGDRMEADFHKNLRDFSRKRCGWSVSRQARSAWPSHLTRATPQGARIAAWRRSGVQCRGCSRQEFHAKP